MLRALLLAHVVLIANSTGARPAWQAPVPRDGEELVQWMHNRYAGKWYKTLTFVQITSFANGKIETWYEAASLPGRLRIDIAPLDSMNTVLYRSDSIYVFKNGKVTSRRPQIHPLMVLGFDVYTAPVERTVAQLRALNIDLSTIHVTTWQGRPVYVVGAEPRDERSNQFWVDQERLLFVRLLERRPRPSERPKLQESDRPAPMDRHETQFNRYVPIGGGWVAPEVIFMTNGKVTLRESYSNMRADVPLAPALFEPKEWHRPAWVN